MAKKMSQEEKEALADARRIYSSMEEAKANPPTGEQANWVVFPVMDPNGKIYYVWAPGREAALRTVTKGVGWKVGQTEELPATKERVAALLAKLSPEDQDAVFGAFRPPEESPPPQKSGKKK